MKPCLVGFASIALSMLPSLAAAQGAKPAAGPSTGEFPSATPSPAPAPTPAPAVDPAGSAAPIPPPPPAAPPAATPPPSATPSAPAPGAAAPPAAAAPSAAVPPTAGAPEPTIVAPLSDPTDTRPIREKRPWFIAGELGWNGLAGLGANLGYHPIPYLGFDAGLGLSLAGWRVGGRMRANLLKSEWTPFLAAGVTYSAGSGGTEIELESKGEKAKFEVLGSPYVQLSGGVSYTGTEGFVFMATTGYSILTRDSNTRFKSGSEDAFNDVRGIYKGGLILSVAFGYAF